MEKFSDEPILIKPNKNYNFTISGAKKDKKSDGTYEKILLKDVKLGDAKAFVDFKKGINIYDSVGEITVQVTNPIYYGKNFTLEF